jgi:hypothetical protein
MMVTCGYDLVGSHLSLPPGAFLFLPVDKIPPGAP